MLAGFLSQLRPHVNGLSSDGRDKKWDRNFFPQHAHALPPNKEFLLDFTLANSKPATSTTTVRNTFGAYRQRELGRNSFNPD
jgi:hypothetical protein